MFSAIALGALLLVGQQEPPEFGSSDRVRRVLDSGAIVLYEQVPSATTTSIQVFTSAKGVQETPTTHGRRHLLEHLLVRGPKKDIDYRLESKGWFLTADTFRDYMQIQLDGPTEHLQVALDSIADIFQPSGWSADEIAAESKTMAQEFALRSPESLLSQSAWTSVYGDAGLDPFGSIGAISATKPDDLLNLFRLHFAADNVVLSISSPLKSTAVLPKAVSALNKLPSARKATYTPRSPKSAAMVVDSSGSALAVPVPGYSNPRAMATLAAAFAIADELDDCFVTYTPSHLSGLVIVGSKGTPKWPIAKMQSEVDRHLVNGRLLAQTWFKRQQSTPTGRASLAGSLQSMVIGGKPELMQEAIQSIDLSEFQRALSEFIKLAEGK